MKQRKNVNKTRRKRIENKLIRGKDLNDIECLVEEDKRVVKKYKSERKRSGEKEIR